jgi:hypothetical protein
VRRAYGQPQTLQQWNNLINDLQATSTPQYPIQQPLLPISTKLKAASINFLWTLPQRQQRLAQEYRLRIAQFKHRLKQAIS